VPELPGDINNSWRQMEKPEAEKIRFRQESATGKVWSGFP
jgi:hypothetical protein